MPVLSDYNHGLEAGAERSPIRTVHGLGKPVVSSGVPSDDARKKKKKGIKFHKPFVLKCIFPVQILSHFIKWKIWN